MVEISIVIPVFNELENLRPLVSQIYHYLLPMQRKFEIIFVDDGSDDGSAELLDELVLRGIPSHNDGLVQGEMAPKDPSANTSLGPGRIHVLHLKRNYGQTAALMAGFENAKGDIIVALDADLQNDPKDIPRLVEKIDQGYDVCSGWRKKRKDYLIRRRLLSFLANWLISFLSGVKLHDYGCTLKAYRRSVIKKVRLYGEMHRFIPIYSSWEGAKLIELPVSHHPRIHGRTKYGVERTYKVMLDLITIVFIGRYLAKPIYFFGGFGLFNILLSLCSFVLAVYFKFWGGKPFVETPLPLICVTFAVTGMICVLMGLLAELIMRTYFEAQGKPIYNIERREEGNIVRDEECAD